MKRFLFFFCTLLIAFSISGQTERSSCYTLAVNSLEQLPILYSKGKTIAGDSILDTWEQNCGRRELITRIKTLLKIQRNEFVEINFDFSDYNELLRYLADEKFKLLMDSVHENPRQFFIDYFTDPDLLFAYNSFTQEFAISIAKEKKIDLSIPACDAKTMLLQLYAGHFKSFFVSLKDPLCKSVLSRYYAAQIRSLEQKASADLAVISGLWIPYGNMSVLGNHPSLGFLIGWGKRKMIYDFGIEFKWGNTKNYYDVLYNDVVTPTNYFFGGYLGLETGYEIANFNRTKMYLLGGVGADGFDSIEANASQDIKGKSIIVLNFNSGIGGRVFSRDGAYIGLEVRHNFINYNNAGGTSLDGNAINVRFLLGVLKNEKRTRERAQLNSIID